MANGQTSFIGGANLRRSGLPVLSAGCQGFRRHDGNRRHELRSLAVHASASIGGNGLDFWFLDGTQLRCLSERTNRDESRHGSDSVLISVQKRPSTARWINSLACRSASGPHADSHQVQIFLHARKNRLSDPSEICALDFKGELRRSTRMEARLRLR